MAGNILFISTFSDSHYSLYGKDFLQSYAENCSAQLICFVDGIEDSECYSAVSENIRIVPYESTVTRRAGFLATLPINDDQSDLGILGDISKQIIRWSFKGFAQLHAYYEAVANYDYLIYIDADSIILRELESDFFAKVLPKKELLAVIDRQDIAKFTESGFVVWNLRHPNTRDWFERYKTYWEGHLYVSLREWHDCEIMDAIRDEMDLNKSRDIKNLGGGGLHAFESGVLGGYIDHKKGYRKYLGFSYERFIKNKVLRRLADGVYKYSTKTIKAITRIINSI